MTTPLTPNIPANPLSIEIAQAATALRALLDQQLEKAGLTFPEWTTLVLLDSGSATADAVVQLQTARQVAPEAIARAALERLQSDGLVTQRDDSTLGLTDDGEMVYRPLRETVASLSAGVWADLPPDDLEATHRTLAEVTRRATATLANVA